MLSPATLCICSAKNKNKNNNDTKVSLLVLVSMLDPTSASWNIFSNDVTRHRFIYFLFYIMSVVMSTTKQYKLYIK